MIALAAFLVKTFCIWLQNVSTQQRPSQLHKLTRAKNLLKRGACQSCCCRTFYNFERTPDCSSEYCCSSEYSSDDRLVYVQVLAQMRNLSSMCTIVPITPTSDKSLSTHRKPLRGVLSPMCNIETEFEHAFRGLACPQVSSISPRFGVHGSLQRCMFDSSRKISRFGRSIRLPV